MFTFDPLAVLADKNTGTFQQQVGGDHYSLANSESWTAPSPPDANTGFIFYFDDLYLSSVIKKNSTTPITSCVKTT